MSRVRSLQYVDEIIIHCSDTPNGQFVPPSRIDTWHRERGFHRAPEIRSRYNMQLLAFGYHYLIQPDGRVDTGRAVWETGAHCKGHNTRSVGICLAGRDEYSDEQWQALRKLIWVLRTWVLPRGVTLHGHNEFADKTCPGFSVKDRMKDLIAIGETCLS